MEMNNQSNWIRLNDCYVDFNKVANIVFKESGVMIYFIGDRKFPMYVEYESLKLTKEDVENRFKVMMGSIATIGNEW